MVFDTVKIDADSLILNLKMKCKLTLDDFVLTNLYSIISFALFINASLIHNILIIS